ncbi:MAG: hypothetical protein ACI30J_03080 [Paludibacteraceae bacterium]
MLLLTCRVSYAGDIRRVNATYDYRSDNANETPDQAVLQAFQRARQQALEEEFGIEVSSVQSTMLHSRTEDGATASTTDVFALSDITPRGEWIETEKEEVLSQVFRDGFWQVRVRVVGKARGLSQQKADIRYAVISNTHDREPRSIFYDGDDLFLRFSSPVSGALCVYLIDESLNAFCLLPYQSESRGFFQIEANHDYLLFSAAADPQADEYVLTCEKSVEQNALFVIFSPNTFTKANDHEGGLNRREESLPRQLPYADFLQWLTRNQTRDQDMLVRKELLSIKR